MKALKELPTTIKILGVYLPLLMAAFIFLLSPKWKALRGLEEDLRRLEVELRKAKEVERNVKLPEMGEKGRWEATKEKMAKGSKEIDFPKLMEELSKQALGHNISDVSLSSFRSPPSSQPQGIRMGDFLIKISFRSEYRETALFLKGLDHLSQWVMIESFEMKKASPLISVDLQVRPVSMVK